MNHPLLVTGGAGFIGAHFIQHYLAASPKHRVINYDRATHAYVHYALPHYAASRYQHVTACISDRQCIYRLCKHQPLSGCVHFAAQSHVDISLAAPCETFHNNVSHGLQCIDTLYTLWRQWPSTAQEQFRFLYVSTDEVFGERAPTDPPCDENSPYQPHNPYAASKAALGQCLYSLYQATAFPILISYSTNNYGPRQYAHKLIPAVLRAARSGQPIQLYGDGLHRRHWLHVKDHCSALYAILQKAQPGDRYIISTEEEWTNRDLVHTLLELVRIISPEKTYPDTLITPVADRKNHDRRYAVSSARLQRDLGWSAQYHHFYDNLKETVQWYWQHPQWLENTHSLL